MTMEAAKAYFDAYPDEKKILVVGKDREVQVFVGSQETHALNYAGQKHPIQTLYRADLSTLKTVDILVPLTIVETLNTEGADVEHPSVTYAKETAKKIKKAADTEGDKTTETADSEGDKTTETADSKAKRIVENIKAATKALKETATK